MNNKLTNQIFGNDLNNTVILKIKLITDMQSLPEEVALKFIASKGKLTRSKKGTLKIVDKAK
jgi:hypothetical protein